MHPFQNGSVMNNTTNRTFKKAMQLAKALKVKENSERTPQERKSIVYVTGVDNSARPAVYEYDKQQVRHFHIASFNYAD